MSWSELVNVVGEFLQVNNFNNNIGNDSYATILVYILWALGGIWVAGHIFNKEVTINNKEVENERRKDSNCKSTTKNH